MILAGLLLLQAAPTPEAAELGRRIAASGMLARMIPVIGEKEAGELIADAPELNEAERGELRRIAAEEADKGRDRLVAAMGGAYAAKLSIEDMRAITAFYAGSAAQRLGEVEPDALIQAVAVLKGYDFKGSVRSAMCARTRKLCPKK